MNNNGMLSALAAALCAVMSAPAFAQADDDAGETSVDQATSATSIARLIEVWGFVKYHHRDSLEGRMAMDQEFFDLYPLIANAGSAKAANSILAEWLERIGTGAACNPCARDAAPAPDEIAIAGPTPQWISTLPKDLAVRAQAIFDNRGAQEANFSVQPEPENRKAILTNEADYSQVWNRWRVQGKDEALWALTLARTWAVLQYWFPYRDIMDESPVARLPDAVAELIEAEDPNAYQRTVSRFVAGANDGHVNIPQFYRAFFPANAGCTMPYSHRFIEGQLVIDGRSVQPNGPLKAGDTVLSIDGESVETIGDRFRPFIAASNPDALMRNVKAGINLGPCQDRELVIDRRGKRMTVTVEWQDYRRHKIDSIGPHFQPGEAIETLEDGVTYVRYQQLKETDLERLRAQANAGRGLIIDMRGYVTANIISELGGMLIDAPVAYARFTQPSPATPGEFVWRDPIILQPDAEGKRITVPVVALIDHSAQSAAEYAAMAWRAAGVRIIGSPSAGADGNVTKMPLPTGGQMNFSGIGVYYPDKSPTQRIGIVPDIIATPTIEGIAAGRDEVLERGIEELQRRQSGNP